MAPRRAPGRQAAATLLTALALATAGCASGPTGAQVLPTSSAPAPAGTSPADAGTPAASDPTGTGTPTTSGPAGSPATSRGLAVVTTRPSTPPGATTRTATAAPVGASTPAASPGSPAKGTVRSAKKGAATWAFTGASAAFADSGASWYYTWSASPGAAAIGSGRFVPMIWGSGSVTPAALAQARNAGGTLLGFNEPDLGGQSNLTVDQALALWPQLQATGLRLVGPAVASGGATAGGWLDRFLSGAAARGYRVDAIALHWYGGDFDPARATAQLRQYLTAVHDRYHKPIWLTEYALMRFGPTVTPSADQQAAFVTASTAMLESLAFVERYAWFSFPTPKEGGLGTGLYSPGGVATAMGRAYRRAGA